MQQPFLILSTNDHRSALCSHPRHFLTHVPNSLLSLQGLFWGTCALSTSCPPVGTAHYEVHWDLTTSGDKAAHSLTALQAEIAVKLRTGTIPAMRSEDLTTREALHVPSVCIRLLVNACFPTCMLPDMHASRHACFPDSGSAAFTSHLRKSD